LEACLTLLLRYLASDIGEVDCSAKREEKMEHGVVLFVPPPNYYYGNNIV